MIALLLILFLSLPAPLFAEEQAAADVQVQVGDEGGFIVHELQRQLERLVAATGGDPGRKAFYGQLDAFYAQRGYRPVWQDRTMVGQLLDAIGSAGDDGLDPEDYHYSAIRGFASSFLLQPRERARYDLLLTDALLTYGYHLRYGKVDPERLDPDWNLSNAASRSAVAFRLQQAIVAGSVGAELDALRPRHFKYLLLRRALSRYRAIAAAGGWPAIPAGPALEAGVRDLRLRELRNRLVLTGDLPMAASRDTSLFMDSRMSAAVSSFQRRHGLEADGVAGAATLAAMNVPASSRVEQIRLNLERYRWFVGSLEPTYVLVNIAGFTLHYVEGGEYRWGTRVIVGRTYRKTPIFKVDMTSVIFNPAWVIPPTILQRDALPAIRAGEDYLQKFDIQVIDRQGRVVDPATVDWSVSRPSYTFRQATGDNGALGRIKFMMPNRHLVYLHDTPNKLLFEQPQRTYSSGCIRVQDPRHLAELVLADSSRWSRARIDAVIESGKTVSIPLPRRIPVFILYLTAVAEEEGVYFRKDVYQRDRAVLEALNRPLPDFRDEGYGIHATILERP